MPGLGESIFATMSRMSREHDAINLSQGYPDFESDPALIELVSHHMRKGRNQYAAMPGVFELREQIALKAQSLYGQKVDPNTEITITAGATQAIFNTLMALIHPGDEVILMEPAYDSYLPGVLMAGGKPIGVPFLAPEFEWPWDEIEAKINEKTRMIIVTNPHNPLGKNLNEVDIQRMKDIRQKHDVLFLVDEVYEHLIYDGLKHQSILRYPKLMDYTILTYSFGKTFHNTGWKLGYSIARPHWTEEIRKVHQFNVFSVNTPIQYALAEYMASEPDYEGLSAFFQNKRDLLRLGLEQTPFKPLVCEGSYFMLADYSDMSDDDDFAFASYLTKEIGVATIPLSPFYSGRYDGKVVRFCFAKKESTLNDALDRLHKLSV